MWASPVKGTSLPHLCSKTSNFYHSFHTTKTLLLLLFIYYATKAAQKSANVLICATHSPHEQQNIQNITQTV